MFNSAPYIMQQLLYQSPTLLVLLIGILFAILSFGRCRAASLFCLLGCGLMLMAVLGTAGMTAMIMDNRSNSNMGAQQVGAMMSTVSILGGVARAVGLGLILGAVFIGRNQSREDL